MAALPTRRRVCMVLPVKTLEGALRDTKQMQPHAGRQPLKVLIGVALATAASCAISAPSAVRAAEPRCFGAAARDPYRSCRNPKLDLMVVPTPAEAEITPNSPCALAEATINLCTFGVAAAEAKGTIALVGDSHAWHWRAAVDVAARAEHWQALDSTRSSCPFTKGIADLSGTEASRVPAMEQEPAALVCRTTGHLHGIHLRSPGARQGCIGTKSTDRRR